MLLNTCQPEADKALLQLGRRLQADGYRFTCVTPLTQQRYQQQNASRPALTFWLWELSGTPGFGNSCSGAQPRACSPKRAFRSSCPTERRAGVDVQAPPGLVQERQQALVNPR